MTTITGKVDRYFFTRDDWSSGILREADGSTVRFAGKVSAPLGEHVSIVGDWQDDPKWGRQFKVAAMTVEIDLSTDGLIRWLAAHPDMAGLGPSRARILVEKFGDHLEERLATDFEGVRKATRIPADTLRKVEDLLISRQQTVLASAELSAYGLTYRQIERLLDKLGINAVNQLRRNPYSLSSVIPRLTFKQIDEAAKRLPNFDEIDPRRIEAGIVACLRLEIHTKGNTWVEYEKLLRASNTYLQFNRLGAKEELRDALERMVAAGDVEVYVDQHGERVALPKIAKSERRIDEKLRLAGELPGMFSVAAAARDLLSSLDGSHNEIVLNPSQVTALLTSATSRASIIAGPAGTGKTSAIAYLVMMARERGKTVALAALAGKAAKRLEERVGQGQKAMTIHRLLGVQPGVGYTHTALCPIPADLIIIDEASMIDVALADDLISAVDFSRSSLVLIGDPHQLPPIGPGAPFRDLIDNALLPLSRLDRIERSGAELSKAAAAILTGTVVRSIASLPGEIPTWTHMTGLATAEDIVASIRAVYVDRLPDFPNLNPLWDVQVLTPQKKGPIGTEALNRLLQDIFQRRYGNPNYLSLSDSERARAKFFTGDKVIQTKNNYSTGVMNGEIGQVELATEKEVTIHFENDETVTISRGTEEFDQVDLAYALTVHKVQGSEYELVLVVAHTDHFIMLTRELLYTAATRARKHLVILGNGRGAFTAARTPTAARRRTLVGQFHELDLREAVPTMLASGPPPPASDDDSDSDPLHFDLSDTI